MPLRRHPDNKTLPTTNPVTLDIPLSSDSSYEEIPYDGEPYSSLSSSTYSPYGNQPTVGEEERLPLHNMEAEPRRRNITLDHSNVPEDGWVHGNVNPVHQSYSNDVDGGEAVYAKARFGYAAGRLPPRPPKEKPHWVSLNFFPRFCSEILIITRYMFGLLSTIRHLRFLQGYMISGYHPTSFGMKYVPLALPVDR